MITLLPVRHRDQYAGRLIRPSAALVLERFSVAREELVDDRWLQANDQAMYFAFHAGLNLAAVTWTARDARYVPAIDGTPVHAELPAQITALAQGGWWRGAVSLLVDGEWMSDRRPDHELAGLARRARSVSSVFTGPHEHLDPVRAQLFRGGCGFFSDPAGAAYLLEALGSHLEASSPAAR